MADPHTPSAPRTGGLSLYANLLDPSPSSDATISRGPVVFKQDEVEASKKQQISAAALRFQPTKRPQLSNQKPKQKSTFPKVPPQISQTHTTPSTSSAATSTQRPPVKSTLADWAAAGDDEDVNGFYAGEKRQRGGKKKRKKNREEQPVVQDWDDIYDPSRPNNYQEYKGSEEEIRCEREWKDRLYAHRIARMSVDEDSEDDRRPQKNNQFAPPPNLNFAPPPMEPPSIPVEAPTGDDAYARRLQLSQAAPSPPAHQPKSLSPKVISRAPVRYNLPEAPAELPGSEAELQDAIAAEEAAEDAPAEEQRSLRPGQKGFAERLMSKYGWSKGTGLGADSSGIINPLRVQIEKRRKKPDSEGGGFADPKGLGKIIGGKRAPGRDEGGKFGDMSEVVVLRGMVDGMDLDQEVDDGGLMQEIGEECGEKYGRVERVFIDRSSAPAKVFVKFTSQLSGLRAVNALEGRIFNGNTISAMFYDMEKFESGIYD